MFLYSAKNFGDFLFPKFFLTRAEKKFKLIKSNVDIFCVSKLLTEKFENEIIGQKYILLNGIHFGDKERHRL